MGELEVMDEEVSASKSIESVDSMLRECVIFTSEKDDTEQLDCKYALDLYTIPLTALRHTTLLKIANALNNEKIFFTSDRKYNRDWRGLVDLIPLPMPGQIGDKAGQALKAWQKMDGANLGKLVESLERIERWDIVDDNRDQIYDDGDTYLIYRKVDDINNNNDELDDLILNKVLTFEDKRKYLNKQPLIKYNSLIIYAQAEDDERFAEEMRDILVEKASNEADRHVCLKIDILPGLMEKDAILGLIAERCSYVIVIISPNYLLESPENHFIVNFAQAYAIDQNKRIIIPCIYGGKNVPLPKELMYLSKLDYNRVKSMHNYDFWGRLKTSIDTSIPERPDFETYETRKLRLINARPMKEMYEVMKAQELSREDGKELIEEVERDGDAIQHQYYCKVLGKAKISHSSLNLSKNSPSSRIPTPKQLVSKLGSKFVKMFLKKKPKKGKLVELETETQEKEETEEEEKD